MHYTTYPYEVKGTNYFHVYCTFEDLTEHESRYGENLSWEARYEISFYNLVFEVHILCYDDWDNPIWTDCYLDYNWHPCTMREREENSLEPEKIIDRINEVTHYLHKNEWLILALTHKGH